MSTEIFVSDKKLIDELLREYPADGLKLPPLQKDQSDWTKSIREMLDTFKKNLEDIFGITIQPDSENILFLKNLLFYFIITLLGLIILRLVWSLVVKKDLPRMKFGANLDTIHQSSERELEDRYLSLINSAQWQMALKVRWLIHLLKTGNNVDKTPKELYPRSNLKINEIYSAMFDHSFNEGQLKNIHTYWDQFCSKRESTEKED